MFIIDFRNKLVSNYGFSVIGNNNVDIVHIYSHFTQYVSGYKVYLKIVSEEQNYVDKIQIDSENILLDDGALLVKWTMGEVSTHCKKINIQLQFENNDGSIVAQTRIVSITLGDTIDVDELVPIIFPQILKQLQDQIDTLKAESVADCDMSYAQDTLTINLKNEAGQTVAQRQVEIKTSDCIVNFSFNASTRKGTFTQRNGDTLELDLSDVYTKGEVDTELAKKLDKDTVSSSALYGVENAGQQVMYAVGQGANANKIPQRTSGGQLNVPNTPTADEHATSKKYVDDKIAQIKKDAYKEVDITEYPTLNDFLASTGEEGFMYLYPIDTTDLTQGYYRYIWEGNAWVNLGDSNIDLSDYYTKTESENKFVDFTTEQNVSGVKNFSNGIKFSNDANYGFAIYQSGSSLYFKVGNSIKWVLSFAGQFMPYNNQSSNGSLGSSSLANHWQSAYINYLTGQDGKPVFVQKIRQKIFNVISTVDTTVLSYLMFFEKSRNVDTTFTLQALETHENGCYPEYKGSITNSHTTDPIVITFTGVSNILCNDENCVITNGTNSTITLTAGTTFEYSILNGNMVAVNFAV